MSEMTAKYEKKMDDVIDRLTRELANIRAGRANPSILDKIVVDYYGTETPINQVAAVATPEARTLTITPWDPSLISVIEKAILKSDLGLNPTNDGKVMRLNFPAPTEERRKALSKEVHVYCEEAKVAIRNVRRDAIDKFKAMKKSSEITEDDLKDLENETQKLTDKKVKALDDIYTNKNKEIMEI